MVKRCCAESCFNSQTTNRNISYFGFPKYLTYAQKWAVAANRPDLLEKKIESLTKYFLCAEHFTDDCFFDPPHNTRLKKTNNPLSIPIPSIFKCNFEKYVPNTRLEKTEDEEIGSKLFEYCIEYIKDDIANESHTNIGNNVKSKAIEPGKSLLNNRALNSINAATDENLNDPLTNVINSHHEDDIDYLNSANSFDEINSYCLPESYDINLIIEEENQRSPIVSPLHEPEANDVVSITCRLCATIYHSRDDLFNIFSDVYLVENINQLLPDTIYSYDGLPQSICAPCIEKINSCIETLNSFKEAQMQLRTVFTGNDI